jgi:hypothetical protein
MPMPLVLIAFVAVVLLLTSNVDPIFFFGEWAALAVLAVAIVGLAMMALTRYVMLPLAALALSRQQPDDRETSRP